MEESISENTSLSSLEMSKDIGDIAASLSLAQNELEAASKDQSGFNYQYSDLSEVIKTAKPVLSKNGLAITQLVGNGSSDTISVTTILSHKSGQYFRGHATMPIVEMKGCNVAQRMGATISYLRRYAYQAILGMASEDNDASSEGLTKASGKTSFSEKKVPVAKGRKKFQNKGGNHAI